jgi:hypothetical protein
MEVRLTHFERGHSIAATTSSFSGDAIRQIPSTKPPLPPFPSGPQNIGKVALTPYGLTKPPVARERQRGNHAGAVQNRRVPGGATRARRKAA